VRGVFVANPATHSCRGVPRGALIEAFVAARGTLADFEAQLATLATAARNAALSHAR